MTRRGVFKGFVILCIFLAGALSGAAVVRFLSEESARSADRDVAEAPLEGGEDGAMEGGASDAGGRPGPYAFARYLGEELDLTPEQRERVQGILEDRAREARRMFTESRERFRAHLEGTVEEVEDALPEAEARQFRQLVDSLERRFQRESQRRDSSPDSSAGGP